MLLVWLLWIVVVGGGLFLGLGSLRAMMASGFDPALALNTVVYLGCAGYALPKLWKLVARRG